MRVLFDLLRWGEGGTQAYARQVIPKLMAALPDSLLLAEPHVAREIGVDSALGDRVVLAPPVIANPYRRHLYQRAELPRVIADNGIDVYFVPGELSGLRRQFVPNVRVVKMFRNLLLINARERRRYSIVREFPARVRLELLASRGLSSLVDSDRVVFVSQHSRDAVTSEIAIRDHRLIYHPVPTMPPASDEASESSNDSERIVLYVSATEPYKRQLEAIEGFLHYRAAYDDPRVRLVLVGPIRGNYGKLVRRAARNAGNSVSLREAASHDQTLQMMRRADVLLFGSTCECCPNILLEYLTSGRPIVCSDSPPMPEIGGNAATYFSSEDPRSLADALYRVLSDALTAEAIVIAARDRCRQFSTEKTVAGTIEALTTW